MRLIDVGTPDAARLHKASMAAPRVAVYTHKDPSQLIGRLAGERIIALMRSAVPSIARSSARLPASSAAWPSACRSPIASSTCHRRETPTALSSGTRSVIATRRQFRARQRGRA
jgi:hypothetical protein